MQPNPLPRLDIWGSCVSRDTLEHLPGTVVGTYVARQSAIVALAPSTDIDVPILRLQSDFQKRMVNGDRTGNVVSRLVKSDGQALVLDLVDERRGVWKFPAGTFLTNSVEAYQAGVEAWAPALGARLVEFGTEEHFELWKAGFENIVTRLRQRGVPIVFLDIDWAEVSVGQSHPRTIRSIAGTVERRLIRGSRLSARSIVGGEPMSIAVERFFKPGPTRAEVTAKRSKRANRRFRRYAEFARERVGFTVRRESSELRMDPDHQWGFAPYHYRLEDYLSICEDLRRYLREAI